MEIVESIGREAVRTTLKKTFYSPGAKSNGYGTANLFMIFEPLAGKRRVKVTDRRTALDFAAVLRELLDSYPRAEKIVLVMDNLNTELK